jgi:hypothetical protein
VARLKDWLPATRLDLRLVWTYMLGQTDHLTKLAERVAELERRDDNPRD